MTATCHNPSCPISLFEHTKGHGECVTSTEPTAPARSPRLAHFEQYGHGLLLQGHGISRTDLAWEMELAFGPPSPGEALHVREQFLHEQRRVMWCGRHGDRCDLEGEWHTHWHALRPTDSSDAHFTFAYYGPVGGF